MLSTIWSSTWMEEYSGLARVRSATDLKRPSVLERTLLLWVMVTRADECRLVTAGVLLPCVPVVATDVLLRSFCRCSAMSPAIAAMREVAFSDMRLMASATRPLSASSRTVSSLTYRSSVFSRAITMSTGTRAPATDLTGRMLP